MWTVLEGAVLGRWPRGEDTRSANDGAGGGIGLKGAKRVEPGIGSVISYEYISVLGIAS